MVVKTRSTGHNSQGCHIPLSRLIVASSLDVGDEVDYYYFYSAAGVGRDGHGVNAKDSIYKNPSH